MDAEFATELPMPIIIVTFSEIMVNWPRSLTLLLAVFLISLGLAFVALAIWIALRWESENYIIGDVIIKIILTIALLINQDYCRYHSCHLDRSQVNHHDHCPR